MAARVSNPTLSKVYQSFQSLVTAPPMLLSGLRQQTQLVTVAGLLQHQQSLQTQIKTSKSSKQKAQLRAQLKALDQTIKLHSATSHGIASAAKKIYIQTTHINLHYHTGKR